MLIGFFTAVIAIVSHVDVSASDWNLGKRMNGVSFLENSVISGILFALAMLCSLDRWLRGKAWGNRIPFSLLMVIFALAIFLCGSVNSLLSLLSRSPFYCSKGSCCLRLLFFFLPLWFSLS